MLMRGGHGVVSGGLVWSRDVRAADLAKLAVVRRDFDATVTWTEGGLVQSLRGEVLNATLGGAESRLRLRFPMWRTMTLEPKGVPKGLPKGVER